ILIILEYKIKHEKVPIIDLKEKVRKPFSQIIIPDGYRICAHSTRRNSLAPPPWFCSLHGFNSHLDSLLQRRQGRSPKRRGARQRDRLRPENGEGEAGEAEAES
ncbi:hypothetical protein LINPERPRIM_LOCUS23680, partial [Linum perenne]